MARNRVNGERGFRSNAKVRTGCATCRIRKIKCDEKRPFCLKCVNTGRICDGYKSPFKFCINQPAKNAHTVPIKPGFQPEQVHPNLVEITPQEVELLSRYFSTKTIFNVKLGCDEEARQILQASLTNPPIRHAVSSLRALREHLEMSRDGPGYVTRQRPSYTYGLQQYSMALGGLAANLSSPDSNGLKSALLCCQIFISIEQVQGNWAAMAQHIIRGLKIMHEYRIRPHLIAPDKLVPADDVRLPLLDVYIIKMFAAPCKFVDPTLPDTSATISPEGQSDGSRRLRRIAPDMRAELTRIATSTIKFLSKVSQVDSIETAHQLLLEKAGLFDSLESWLIDLELMQMETRLSNPEPISVSFMRCLHSVLKVVLLGTLDSSPDVHSKLQIENERLQEIANSLGDRLRDYRMDSGTSNG